MKSRQIIFVCATAFLSAGHAIAAPNLEDIADQLLAAVKSLDAGLVGDLYSPTVKEHGPVRFKDIAGAPPTSDYAPASFAEGIRSMKSSLGESHVIAESPVIDHDRIAIFFQVNAKLGAPVAGLGDVGEPVRFEAADLFRVVDGKIVEHWTQTDHFGLVRELTSPNLHPDPIRALTATPFKILPPGTLPESIVEDNHGNLLITELFRGIIARVDRSGTLTTIATLDGELAGGPGFISMARQDNDLYATFMTPHEAGIWHVSLGMSDKGISQKFVNLPKSASPNGIALDGKGGLIIGDNLGGLWRVTIQDRQLSRWLEHPLLSRRQYFGSYPAANGVQRVGNTLFVTNSDLGLLVTIPILDDGSAGTPTVRADEIPADDLAVSADGTAYLTTHPFNSVIEVKPDGTRTQIVGVSSGVVGPAAAMLRDEPGHRVLYVVADGGAYAPVPNVDARPGIFRVFLN